MKDQKAALGSGLKPDITHVRKSTMTYDARAKEYGSDKYERANYLRSAGSAPRADFERYRAYLRACVSHVVETLDAMEAHQANDPTLADVDGMRAAAYAPDTDETPGAKVGASYLPHVAHAMASLTMAIEQATRFGLLPKDPGQPWKRDANAPGFIDSLSGKRHTARRVTRYGIDELDDVQAVALGGLEQTPPNPALVEANRRARAELQSLLHGPRAFFADRSED
jgi:hypothetical protein